MKASLLLMAVALATLSSALPNRKRSAPCAYHKGGEDPKEPLIQDSYTVELEEGYSLKAHYEFLGFDLSAKAEEFHYMSRLHMYRLEVDASTMHELIRFDPGVRRVSHNMVLNPEAPWYHKHGEVEEAKEEAPLRKRWHDWYVETHASRCQVNEWEPRKFYEHHELCHTVCMHPLP